METLILIDGVPYYETKVIWGRLYRHLMKTTPRLLAQPDERKSSARASYSAPKRRDEDRRCCEAAAAIERIEEPWRIGTLKIT